MGGMLATRWALMFPDRTERLALVNPIGPEDWKEVAARMGDYPALGKKAARAIPGARLVEIPSVGHLPQVEAFDAYREALITFLQETAPQPATRP